VVLVSKLRYRSKTNFLEGRQLLSIKLDVHVFMQSKLPKSAWLFRKDSLGAKVKRLVILPKRDCSEIEVFVRLREKRKTSSSTKVIIMKK